MEKIYLDNKQNNDSAQELVDIIIDSSSNETSDIKKGVMQKKKNVFSRLLIPFILIFIIITNGFTIYLIKKK